MLALAAPAVRPLYSAITACPSFSLGWGAAKMGPLASGCEGAVSSRTWPPCTLRRLQPRCMSISANSPMPSISRNVLYTTTLPACSEAMRLNILTNLGANLFMLPSLAQKERPRRDSRALCVCASNLSAASSRASNRNSLRRPLGEGGNTKLPTMRE